jgi:hypothetical protein
MPLPSGPHGQPTAKSRTCALTHLALALFGRKLILKSTIHYSCKVEDLGDNGLVNTRCSHSSVKPDYKKMRFAQIIQRAGWPPTTSSRSIHTMSSSKAFLDKVLALRPDLAGANEKDKATVSTLAADSSKLAEDVQVSTRLRSTCQP